MIANTVISIYEWRQKTSFHNCCRHLFPSVLVALVVVSEAQSHPGQEMFLQQTLDFKPKIKDNIFKYSNIEI